jgi:hypothetical protein
MLAEKTKNKKDEKAGWCGSFDVGGEKIWGATQPSRRLRRRHSRTNAQQTFADRLAVVLAEIRNGLEVRHQLPGQPHQLEHCAGTPAQAVGLTGRD